MNVAGFLAQSARSYGDRPAITVGQSVWLDYARLGRQSAGLAAALRQQFGLVPGDSVLLAMSNNPDYVTTLNACWHAGLVAVPVNAKLHPKEIAFIGLDCGAKVVFATPDLADGIATELPHLPLILPRTAEFAALAAHDPISMQETLPTDTAWIFYTSGTTGRPKGALLSHRNLSAMTIAYLADVDFLGPGDSLLHLAATSHASGLFGLSHLAKASNHILPESGGYDAGEMGEIINANQSLTFFAPTTLLNTMAKDNAVLSAPLDHIRTILTGAGPVYAEDIKLALTTFGPRLWNGYGQGESPCTITAMSKDQLWRAFQSGDENRLISVGVARTGMTVRIVSADGREVEPGEMGEVVVQGETVMSGYLNHPAASAEALRNGWLYTGDLGRMDSQGYLQLSDRKKDLIITGGMNVYAREVEEALLAHPGVSEVAVIGAKDPKWGESVLAVIVAPAGSVAPGPDALDTLCLDRLARFKRPKRYVVVDALPKNSAGKVLKAALRQTYGDIFI